MPLPTPVPREPVHTRSITCTGYLREDGLWDIEGHLVDHKHYSFDSEVRGHMEAGAPVHDMWIRMTVDEQFVVREVDAVTDAGPYSSCPEVTPNFARLAGLNIGHGWRRKVRQFMGGINGCTHLVDLLDPMATTAFQSIAGYQSKRGREAQESTASDSELRRHLINSCYAWSDQGEVVRRWAPDFYMGIPGKSG
ncbi:MAG: DUF2889 domain-containing protein [SAR324 cluster bacterium]|nr:DUF2889 domain-containing protein [SAR324 cluster bacterium]